MARDSPVEKDSLSCVEDVLARSEATTLGHWLPSTGSNVSSSTPVKNPCAFLCLCWFGHLDEFVCDTKKDTRCTVIRSYGCHDSLRTLRIYNMSITYSLHNPFFTVRICAGWGHPLFLGPPKHLTFLKKWASPTSLHVKSKVLRHRPSDFFFVGDKSGMGYPHHPIPNPLLSRPNAKLHPSRSTEIRTDSPLVRVRYDVTLYVRLRSYKVVFSTDSIAILIHINQVRRIHIPDTHRHTSKSVVFFCLCEQDLWIYVEYKK